MTRTATAGGPSSDVARAGHQRMQTHNRTPAGLPNPVTWSIHLVRAVIEVQSGQRTSPQLVGWAASGAIEGLCRRSAGVLGSGTVRSARAMQVGANEVEAIVLVDVGPRTRAVTVRLVGVNMPLRAHHRHRPGPRWLATHLQLV